MTETPADAPAEIERSASRDPIQRVLVTGASGFLGRHVCAALVAAGYRVTALVRSPPKSDDAQDGVDYEVGDVTKAESLRPEVFSEADAILHLVGIIVELRGVGQTFLTVHVEGTANVVAAASQSRTIQKFVYVSALGASPASRSDYARSKARAESIVTASEIRHTIFRPSIILGKNGDFVAQIESLIKRPPLSPFPLPFVPVPGSGKNLFQPVYVDDLTDCMIRSLTQAETDKQIYEIGGGEQVTFNALIEAFCQRLNVRKKFLHVPTPLLFVAASILEALLPRPPVTVDQVINLGIDNVCDNTAVIDAFGIAPKSFTETLELILPARGPAG